MVHRRAAEDAKVTQRDEAPTLVFFKRRRDRFCRLVQPIVQLLLRVPFPLQHDAGAVFGGGDVVEWVGVQEYEVSPLSFLDRAHFLNRAEEH